MLRTCFLLSTALTLILSGCATADKSTWLSLAIGSVIGASIGSSVNENNSSAMRTQGTNVGLGVGALIGGFIGNDVYKKKLKTDETKKTEGNADGFEMFGNANDQDKRPSLRPAQVRIRYVEDQIKDGVFVPAHFEYEISEPARWERSK